MQTLIRCENIIKTIGEGTEQRNILDGISLNIRRGEFVAVMGPSGSGKSTLLYALSGMDTLSSGSVIFDGVSLAELKDAEHADLRRKNIGFVFQQPTLLKHLDILDNIMLPALRDARKDVARLRNKALHLMQKTGIAGLEARAITQTSGGQLQRVGICRALMGDPKIIFGDEPTGALNSAAAGEIMQLFSAVHQEGVSVLLVTHDIRVAAHAQRVLFILDGKLAGEYCPDSGAESASDIKQREEKLAAWLAESQF